MSAAKLEGTARERLLAAANELFYEEGIHTVGIDRVIERAGVAKASLYAAFESKDELVRAYIEQRAARRRERITAQIAKHAAPRAKLLSIYDLLGETAAQPTFRGCPFINITAEGARESDVTTIAREMRAWTRDLITSLVRELGAKSPELVARQLVLLYDGALVRASIDRDPTAAKDARALAATLIDAAAPRIARTRRPSRG